MSQVYDTIIIGAGMSGLAAGIRLAMFGQKVCIVEKHTISGGLNSFYARKGRKLDVGLHAMTNFANKGERGLPLTKLLKQLRIPYADLQLSEQSTSRVSFPGLDLNFSNDPELLEKDVSKKFPSEAENFLKLVKIIKDFDEVNLENEYESARARISSVINDKKLVEMILCPLLIYGSAWENDMDFSQFVIMFKSIFLEGFSRPKNGVRTILKILLDKYKALGGEIRFRSGVASIEVNEGNVNSLTLDSGVCLKTKKILSSMGLPETMKIVSHESDKVESLPAVGKMSFTETILFYDKLPMDAGVKDTIVFYNNREDYKYQRPEGLCDFESAVVCFPNNFGNDDNHEGVIRVTFMANYDKWKALEREDYLAEKEIVLNETRKLIKNLFPNFEAKELLNDVFTPTTIERYTGHFGGTVYGSTEKSRDGRTHIDNLFICGTDQGFLGIVGAMLSGISMANLHCLMSEA